MPATKVQRTKSISSATARRRLNNTSETADPNTARLHALIAANRAMSRSCGSASETLSRSESKKSTAAPTPRSIQFASTVHLYGRRTAQKQAAVIKPDDIATTTRHSFSQAPPSYQYHSLVVSDIDSREETYGAQPSSYRRLKKSKSMSDSKGQARPTTSIDSASSPTRTPSLRNAKSSLSLRNTSLGPRLKRSFLFLRSSGRRRDPLVPYQPELTCSPESIALARSQFLQDATLQGKNETPRAYRTSPAACPKPFHQTMRSPGSGSPSINNAMSEFPHSPVAKKRSISASLRQRFKKTISRLKTASDTLPPQQLTASRSHFSEAPADPGDEADVDGYDGAAGCPDRRRSLYTPSRMPAQVADASEHLTGKTQFASSTHSLSSTSQSRLTSWTNSASSNSIRGNLQEKKRLSVIKEDGGPHHPSSSAGQHIGGVAVFQRPLQLEGKVQVDNQRLYSALIRRIDQEQDAVKGSEHTMRQLHKYQVEATQTTSLKPTIRTVRELPSRTLSEVCHIDDPPTRPASLCDPFCSNEESYGQRTQIEQSQKKYPNLSAPSSERQPRAQNPFLRQLEQGVESRGSNESSPSDSGSVRVVRPPGGLRETAFVRSSESVYSRTTNGGTNPGYPSFTDSSESFFPRTGPKGFEPGVATIFLSDQTSVYGNMQNHALTATQPSATFSEKGAWRGWMESQMMGIGKKNSWSKGHFREQAQIDSDDVELGALPVSSPSSIKTPLQTHLPFRVMNAVTASTRGRESHHPCGFVDETGSTITCVGNEAIPSMLGTEYLDDATRIATSKPIDVSVHTVPHPEQSLLECTEVPRETLPRNSVNALRLRKSKPVLSIPSHPEKENKPFTMKLTTSRSTSNQYKSQFRNTRPKGELRETSGNMLRGENQKLSSSTIAASDSSQDSPSDKYRKLLSARLSRPFDMDIPECNRPFDSTYLGQNDQGSLATRAVNGRLSVATNNAKLRPTKSYGGLGLAAMRGRKSIPLTSGDADTTALPQIPDASSITRTSSLASVANSSRRLVSNLLWSRRKENQQKPEPGTSNVTSSPAFI